MNSIVEEKVKGYLQTRLHRASTECGTILFNMRKLAHSAGHDLGYGFGRAGLSVGPDARVAAGIVMHALGGGGSDAVSKYLTMATLDRWVRTSPGRGR